MIIWPKKVTNFTWSFDLKKGVENLTSGQDHALIRKVHLAYRSIRIVDLNTSMVFLHCSSLSLSKGIAEKLLVTFHDLKWPCRHQERSLVAIFRFRVSSLPVTRCLRVFQIVFVQKRRLSILSHLLIMDRSQIWPDLGSPISKFRDIGTLATGTDINLWKFRDRSFGVAMTSVQTFSEVRSLDATWRPDFEWPGSEILTTCAEEMYTQVCLKT